MSSTMNNREQPLPNRLRMHVEQLATVIGERNLFMPEALQRAASYVAEQWDEFGYAVKRFQYDVSGVSCANLVAERNGSTRPSEILLLGAHYDSVFGSPGANDNASGVARAQNEAGGQKRGRCEGVATSRLRFPLRSSGLCLIFLRGDLAATS
jgi:acetylornithine deacetylase/succinyl-diaminopimelate desuccinylase-like protein